MTQPSETPMIILFCALCEDPGVQFNILALLDHVRLMHPSTDGYPETWPDGGIVVYDDCPEIAP